MRVSACMIAKNESNCIAKCINSYKSIADEIIVADTGSTDNTAEIAESLGAVVYRLDWENDFSKAKNYVLDKATGDWIIFLDADEYFEEGSAQKLRLLMEFYNNDSNIEAINVTMYHITTDEQSVFDYNSCIRAFKCSNDTLYEGNIHEIIKKSGRNLTSVYSKDIKIFHTGYTQQLMDAKVKRNISLLKQKEKTTDDPMTYFYLCNSYFVAKEYANCIYYADKLMSHEQFDSLLYVSSITYKCYIFKFFAMISLKTRYSFTQIKNLIDEGLERFPLHPEIKRCEAVLYKMQMRFELALQCYQKSLDLDRTYDSVIGNGFSSSIAEVYCSIGHLFLLKNDKTSAMEAFIQSLLKSKHFEESLKLLLSIIKDEKDEEIILLLNSLYRKENKEDVKLLLQNLSALKIRVPFLYYFRLWYKIFGQEDDSVIAASFLNENYNECLKLSLSYSQNNEDMQIPTYGILSVLCGYMDKWYYSNKNSIPSDCIAFFDAFFNKHTNADLSNTAKTSFLYLVSELLLLKDENTLLRLLSAAGIYLPQDNTAKDGSLYTSRDTDLWLSVADQFSAAGDYIRSALLYEAVLQNKENIQNLKEVYAKLGFCFYKSGKHNECVKAYKSALAYGYERYDIIQILEWILFNDLSNDLMGEIKEIIKDYGDKILKTASQHRVSNNPSKEASRSEITDFMFIDNPMVSIVVLAYNKVEYTRLCIESIYQYSEGIDYELIAVNNGSSDGTLEYFESLPKKRIVNIPVNHGPCHGFNEGIKAAKGRYVACVCNDFIFTSNWLHNLIRCMESDEKIGYVSPGSSFISNLQQINGSYSSIEEMQQFAKSYNVSDPSKWEERVRLLPNVLFVRREIFDIVGYYDPIYVYGEFADDDLSFRIRRAGYKLVYCGDTFTHHFGSVTGGHAQRENKSLELGREIFKQKFFVDAWEDVLYDLNLLSLIESESNSDKQNYNVLGVDPRCGATLIQAKNILRKLNKNEISLNASIQDTKYFIDLKTICSDVKCLPADMLPEAWEENSFDIILILEPLNIYRDAKRLVSSSKKLLNQDGRILLFFENSFHYSKIQGFAQGQFISSALDNTLMYFDGFVKELKHEGLTVNRYLIEKAETPQEDMQLLDNISSAFISTSESDLVKERFTAQRYIFELKKTR